MKALHTALAISVAKVIALQVLVFLAETAQSRAQCPETRHWVALNTVPGPVGRKHHAMAYDSGRRRTVLFGGNDVTSISSTNDFYGDTWEFDGENWQQKFPVHSPPPRSGHTLSYDVRRGVTVLYGGKSGTARFGDVWEWNGSDWTEIAIAGAAPDGRADHGMAYDITRGVHVMYGGTRASALAETWEYDGTAQTWTLRVGPQGYGPGPRFWFQLAFDAARNKTLLFGGATSARNQLSDTWVWDGAAGAWTRLFPPTHPGIRENYSLAYDSLRRVVLLQCGAGFDDQGSFYDRESWEWNGDTWADLTFTYSFCCPRSAGGMVYDSRLQQMLLFGGYGAQPQTIWALRAEWIGSTVYVDRQNSGPQDGSITHPYQTVRQASSSAAGCSFLSIQAGDYPEGALTIDKALNLNTRNGPVRIH